MFDSKTDPDGQDQGTGMEPTKRGLVVNSSDSDGIYFFVEAPAPNLEREMALVLSFALWLFFLIYDGNEDDGSSLSYYCRFFFRLLVVFVG